MDYKESTVSGTTWQRCTRIVIENPYQQTPSVNFVEEKRITLGDENIGKLVTGIYEQFNTPTQEFELRNPSTGALLNKKMTDQELYVAIWSRYMFSAEKRDAAAVPPSTP